MKLPHTEQRGKAGSRTRPLSFDSLAGWSEEDHEAAWSCFERTREITFPNLLRQPGMSAREFFEASFTLEKLDDGRAHFTGYFEPEIAASPVETKDYRYPIYAPPADLDQVSPSRAEIDGIGVLKGSGLELAWLSDPVEAFFLQVQGSGRLVFRDGTRVRVGFAAKNGHPYRSIGAELVRRGEFSPQTVSAGAIKEWLRAHGTALLEHNPSYVFFRILDIPENEGPLGSLGRSVTADRSIAVDPAYVSLGLPVWTTIAGVGRLRIAQDIGSAIKGPNRVDVFFGTGEAAGEMAGNLNTDGFMVCLVPKKEWK